jgi:hypothetical protein
MGGTLTSHLERKYDMNYKDRLLLVWNGFMEWYH